MPKTIAQELAEKTYQELAEPEKPQARSRISNTPNGYVHLVAWSNACLLRVMVRSFTDSLPKGEFRVKTQLDDASRSVVANIEEGYRRPTTNQYLDFLGFSYASLGEVKGDIQRSLQDGYIPTIPGSSLAGIGIPLLQWYEALRLSVISRPVSNKAPQYLTPTPRGVYRNLKEIRGEKTRFQASRSPFLQLPLNSFKFLYLPVDTLRVDSLSYEIFIELINKTDWNLRKLVVSLEDKFSRDQKYYQVEKARIRSNT